MFRSLRKSLLAIVAILSLVAAPMVSVAADSFTSGTSGREVSWDDGWTEERTGADGSVSEDSVSIRHQDSGSELTIVFVSPTQDLEQIRDNIIDESDREDGTVSSIEQGSYGSVEYQVDLLREEGDSEAEGVFTLKLIGSDGESAVVYVLITQVENFSAGVSAVQVGVTIDDGAAMNGVDPAGMQSFLQLAQSTSSQTAGNTQLTVPTAEPEAVTQPPVTGAGNTYTNTFWGYTVVYDDVFMDMTSGSGGDLMLGSPYPVLVVGFQGMENPGFSPAVLFEALTPTFIDTLGPGGSYFDGGHQSDRAYWAGFTSDGNQLMQQLVIISPDTVVIVTIMGEPGVPMNTIGEVTLNGISVFGN